MLHDSCSCSFAELFSYHYRSPVYFLVFNIYSIQFCIEMVQRNKQYILLISIGLLFFTQTVIPYLHNHAERHFKHGIVEDHGDSCTICSLDIVPAGFILPSVFCFILAVFIVEFRNSIIVPQHVYTLCVSQGRAPPAL